VGFGDHQHQQYDREHANQPFKFLTQLIITNENHAVVVRSRYSVNRCHYKSIKKTLSACPDRNFNKGSSKINRNDAVEDLKSVQETKVCV